jgi:hypothetical protein
MLYGTEKTCEKVHTVKKQGVELHNGFFKVFFEKNEKTRRFFRILVKIYGRQLWIDSACNVKVNRQKGKKQIKEE